jgi:hypothetical protein
VPEGPIPVSGMGPSLGPYGSILIGGMPPGTGLGQKSLAGSGSAAWAETSRSISSLGSLVAIAQK